MDSNSPLPVEAIKASRLGPVKQAQAQSELIKQRYWVCCANCLWLSSQGVCSLHGIIPLPQYAVLGCPDWDGLPF